MTDRQTGEGSYKAYPSNVASWLRLMDVQVREAKEKGLCALGCNLDGIALISHEEVKPPREQLFRRFIINQGIVIRL